MFQCAKIFATVSQLSPKVLEIFTNVELDVVVLKQMVFPLRINVCFFYDLRLISTIL